MLSQIRLSVCPSHGWISRKRLNLRSCNFHHTVAHPSAVCDISFIQKFRRDPPPRAGASNEGGLGKRANVVGVLTLSPGGSTSYTFNRCRGDMIETFKILHGIYHTAVAAVLPICQESVTRGNSCRLVKSFSRYDVRKYSFTQRIVNIWNGLPEHVVNSSSVNSFKNNLDKFWVSQEVYYNFNVI